MESVSEEHRKCKVALMALWELWEQGELTTDYRSGQPTDTAMKRIEEEVINPIYSAEDSTSWSLAVDTFMEGGAI